MTDPSSPTDSSIQKASIMTTQRRKILREEKEAQERHEVTRESVQKTNDLVQERISVRDFALEALDREKAERTRRAREFQAAYRGTREKELEDEKVRRILEEDKEEDEKRWAGKEVWRTQVFGSQGDGRDEGDQMDTD